MRALIVSVRLTFRLAGAALFIAGTVLHAQESGLGSDEAARNAPRTAESESGTTSFGAPSAATNASEPAQTSSSAPGKLHQELEVLTNVLDQHRRSGHRDAQASTLCALGNSYNAAGQQQRAIEQFQLALAIYRETGDGKGEANVLTQIGDVYRGWGFSEMAVHFYHEALQRYESTDDKPGTAVALNNLGVAYLELGNKKKSLEYLNRALGAYHEVGDDHAVALAFINLGAAEFFLGRDAKRALGMFRDAVTELELLHDRDNEADAFKLMGVVWAGLHRQDLAESNLQRALAIYREVRDAKGEAAVLKKLKDSGWREDIASVQ